MHPVLRNILRNVDVEQSEATLSRLVDEAIMTLPMRSACAQSASELRTAAITLWRNIHTRILGLAPESDALTDDHAWQQCVRLLNSIYEGPRGVQAAVQIACSGVEGALCGVMGKLAARILVSHQAARIRAGAEALTATLSLAEQLEVVQDYCGRYCEILPPEILRQTPAELVPKFARILEKHPQMMATFRQIGRGDCSLSMGDSDAV